MWPSTLRENIGRRDASLNAGHMVPDVDRMGYSEGPERGISNFGPVNGRMEHHRTGDAHDGLNGPFGMTVMVVCTNTSESHDLTKVAEVSGKSGGGERWLIVSEVFLRYNSVVTAHELKGLFGTEGGVCGHGCLMLNMDEIGSMVHKNTTAGVHIFGLGFASRIEEASFGAANEVIH